jgi:hypothetical protein
VQEGAGRQSQKRNGGITRSGGQGKEGKCRKGWRRGGAPVGQRRQGDTGTPRSRGRNGEGAGGLGVAASNELGCGRVAEAPILWVRPPMAPAMHTADALVHASARHAPNQSIPGFGHTPQPSPPFGRGAARRRVGAPQRGQTKHGVSWFVRCLARPSRRAASRQPAHYPLP